MSMDAIEKGKERDVYFVTGATGLMGSEFVYEVLSKSKATECILLIRAENEKKLESRLLSLLKYLFSDDEVVQEMRTRVTAVAGDVGTKNLGMSTDDWELVSKESDYILHAAALTDWGAHIEDAKKVNVSGVKEIILLAHSCAPKLKKFIHISSAYVSGKRKGHIFPDEESSYENACDNYQLSKIEGEALVKAEHSNLPITIIKPVAVVGNSKNGRTPTYKTFYYPLQLLYNGLPLILPVSKQGNLEAVPSDWTAKVMLEMMLDSSTNGKSYHLSSGEKVLTNKAIKKIIYKTFSELGEKPGRSLYLPYWVYKTLVSKIIKEKVPDGKNLDEKLRLYRHYMTYKRVFDNSSTKKFAEDRELYLPDFKNYLPVLMDYAIKDKWRRKREVLSKRMNRVKQSA